MLGGVRLVGVITQRSTAADSFGATVYLALDRTRADGAQVLNRFQARCRDQEKYCGTAQSSNPSEPVEQIISGTGPARRKKV